MQYSDTSTNQGVLQDVYFITGTDSTSYAANDIVRNANRWLYRAVAWSFEADTFWNWDDRNLTTHAEATATLVADQVDYSLPTDIIELDAVFVKDSNGEYQRLRQLDQTDQRTLLSEAYETSGMPFAYDLKGASIFLYPPPAAASVTTAAGLLLHVSRNIDAFTSSDTTQEVPLPEPFARIMSYGASYDYLIVNGPAERAQSIRAEIQVMKEELQKHLSMRNKDRRPRLQPLTTGRDLLV